MARVCPQLLRAGRVAAAVDGTHRQSFYALAPQALLPVLVLLSTAATVIASQATISGAFSVTREAVQLDLLPRVRVDSASAHGQIYVPAANLFMFVAVVLFVIGFGSSSALRRPTAPRWSAPCSSPRC